jgi:hypothetical protein
MKKIMGIEFPSDQAFQEAGKFVEQHPALTLPGHIRLILKKYNKKISPRTYKRLRGIYTAGWEKTFHNNRG